MIAGLLALAQELAHGPAPGPRRDVDGLAAFQTVSRVDFGDAANRFTAAYVFPDRVRWHFEPYEPVARPRHQYVYRSGAQVRALEGGRSREFAGRERERAVLQMELRRAVFLWPHGFAWRAGEAGESSATVFADSCCAREPVGTLVATLADGRPTRVVARDADANEVEALAVHGWQERDGRSWPRTLALESPQGGFTETVEAIETRVDFLELSFLPPDVRPLRAGGAKGPRIQALDIVAMTYAARDLPGDASWEVAREQARSWLAETSAAVAHLGLAVDPVPTFELAPDGRATRCLLRLSAPVRPPPEGFETWPERSGLFVLAQDLAAIDGALLGSLTSAVPADALPGRAYLRIHTRTEVPLELVLPLVPRD